VHGFATGLMLLAGVANWWAFFLTPFLIAFLPFLIAFLFIFKWFESTLFGFTARSQVNAGLAGGWATGTDYGHSLRGHTTDNHHAKHGRRHISTELEQSTACQHFIIGCFTMIGLFDVRHGKSPVIHNALKWKYSSEDANCQDKAHACARRILPYSIRRADGKQVHDQ